jgi:hypothetical protein
MRSRPALLLAGLLLTAALPAATLPAHAEVPLVLPIAPTLDSRQIAVTVDPGLTRTRALPPGELRAARVAMLDDQDVAPDLLRQLADRRDGLAALRLTRHLVDQGGTPSDIAYYGSIAILTGRIWPLEDVVGALMLLDPATEPADRVNMAMAALYPQAWAGNALALDALIALNGDGRLFGPMSDRTRDRILEQAALAGDGRVHLHLAVSELWGQPTDEARARARVWLDQALAGSHLGVRTAAQAVLAGLDAADPGAGLADDTARMLAATAADGAP